MAQSSGMRLQTAILPGSISVGSLAPSGKAHLCSIRESSESLTVENRSLIGHVSGFELLGQTISSLLRYERVPKQR